MQPGDGLPLANDQASATAQTTASSDLSFATSADAAIGNDGEEAAAPAPDEQAWDRENREASLRFGNSQSGTVGLLHLQTPFSGAAGTFRVSFLSGYFSGSGFLCNSSTPCGGPNPVASSDEAKTVTSDIALSATLLPYLEAYIAMHSAANRNSLGFPKLLQVVGDTNFGLKLFTPAKADRLFAVGGSMDLYLLNGSGNMGPSNASFTMRLLGGVDLTRHAEPTKRVPLRFHGALGYQFDGSNSLIEDIEAKGRSGERINRIERFGLDINRLDSVLIGVGAEYVHKNIQPFVEWNFDIPANFREPYECTLVGLGRAPGDRCLADAPKFASTPSRLSFGARITPSFLRGLQGLLAFDVGTGATSTFIEEVAPELPWRLFFGLGFAHDITSSGPVEPPRVVKELVQLPPSPEYRVVGLVLDEKTQQPIPNAIIKFQDQALTGMVARQDGSFETTNLAPGTYTFALNAEGYRDGVCSVTVAQTTGHQAGAPDADAPGATPTTDAFGIPTGGSTTGAASVGEGGPAGSNATASAAWGSGPIVTNVACPLKALPAVGAVQGALVDGETNLAVTTARVTIRDVKGRELALDSDGAGAFRFENVPVGSVKISVSADGYMPASVDLEVKAKAEQRVPITLNKRPKKASVMVTANEVKITKQVNFANDSATILPESMGLVQEIALTISEHAELVRIEIQGHTDNTGTPAYNKRLSQERAEAVRTALISLGVEASRLTAVGYGPDKPLLPNASEANKAKNRRVQLLILEKR
jgi:outer membrane protein OmpA-like peptidoglycan-associated protein